MEPRKRWIMRIHQRLGPWMTVFLLLPMLFFVWPAAEDPFLSVVCGDVPRYVMSGKLFSDKFDPVHAGWVMDQPTIGKWLFWVSVMTGFSLPYAAAVRWISDRRNIVGYLAYGFPIVVLCVFLLCILSWPVCWLIQYIHSMGFTARRVYGLAYAIGGGLLVLGFLRWAVRKPKHHERDSSRYCKKCDYDLTGNVSGVCPECGTVVCSPKTDPGCMLLNIDQIHTHSRV